MTTMTGDGYDGDGYDRDDDDSYDENVGKWRKQWWWWKLLFVTRISMDLSFYFAASSQLPFRIQSGSLLDQKIPTSVQADNLYR